jgi:hypothetical protein
LLLALAVWVLQLSRRLLQAMEPLRLSLAFPAQAVVGVEVESSMAGLAVQVAVEVSAGL